MPKRGGWPETEQTGRHAIRRRLLERVAFNAIHTLPL